jgi:hypothetical protein
MASETDPGDTHHWTISARRLTSNSITTGLDFAYLPVHKTTGGSGVTPRLPVTLMSCAHERRLGDPLIGGVLAEQLAQANEADTMCAPGRVAVDLPILGGPETPVDMTSLQSIIGHQSDQPRPAREWSRAECGWRFVAGIAFSLRPGHPALHRHQSDTDAKPGSGTGPTAGLACTCR